MSRLFWKFFCFILLAQLATMVGVGTTIRLWGAGSGRFWKPPLPVSAGLVPGVPMTMMVVASFLLAALLAWYCSKPIRSLRSAFSAAAAGDLDVRLGYLMSGRRDELADLGRDFDRMADRLRDLMRGQRRLLDDVSHQLRSPLARLQAALGLARQQPERLDECLVRIEREALGMDALVGELLTLSKLEAGVVEAKEEVVLDELLADIVEDANFEARMTRRTVRLDAQCDALVSGRPDLLHQAIENVVRNAVKYTCEDTEVIVRAQRENSGREVRVSILDAGPGVLAGDLETMFKPFWRSEQTASRDGHGLGLAIARRILEVHGGSISASNRTGGGLCVDLLLAVSTAAGTQREFAQPTR